MARAQRKGHKNGEHGLRRSNGSGTLMKSGKYYYALWYTTDGNGKRKRNCVSTKTDNIDDAREFLKKMVKDYAIDDALGERERVAVAVRNSIGKIAVERAEIEDQKPALLLADGWKTYERSVSRPRSGEATFKNYGQWYGLFLSWVNANHSEVTEMRHVTAAVANEYASHLLTRVRGTTFNRHMNALALVWRHVAADFNAEAKLKSNPFAWDKATGTGIRRVTLNHAERPHRRRDLNLDEIAKLLKEATGELRVLIALGFYTGLRLGDCALLRWEKIDRVNGLIVTRSAKTDEETRTRINPALVKIIEESVKTKRGYLLPEIAGLYNGGTTGRVKLVRMIQDLFESVGIQTSTLEEGKRARPDCGFHSLRHAFVTQLERVGVSLSERQRLAGHATAAMTEHYTHEDGSAALALPDLTKASGKGKTTFSPVLTGILAQVNALTSKADLHAVQRAVAERMKNLK